MSEALVESQQRVEPTVTFFTGAEVGLREVDVRHDHDGHVRWLWSKVGKYAVIERYAMGEEEGVLSSYAITAAEEHGRDLFEHPNFYYFRALGNLSIGKELVPVGLPA